MPGPSPAPCTFPDDFVQVALDTVHRRTVAVQVVQRFRLALLLHEQPDMKNDKAAKEVGLSARQVQRWRSRRRTERKRARQRCIRTAIHLCAHQ